MRLQFNKFEIGGFTVYETVGMVGEELPLSVTEEILPDHIPSVFMVTGGRFTLGPFPPDGRMYDMPQGFSAHLIESRPAGDRAVTCVEDFSSYICVNPPADVPYALHRIELPAGQSRVIQAGSVLFAGKGDYTLNGEALAAPGVIHANSGAMTLVAVTDFIGMEGWLL